MLRASHILLEAMLEEPPRLPPRILRLLLALGAVLLILVLATPSRAQLTVCNTTSDVAFLAVKTHAGAGRWLAQGWFRVQPRECAEVVREKLTNRYAYYAANTGGGLFWEEPEPQSGAWCLTAARIEAQDSHRCWVTGTRPWNWNAIDTEGASAFRLLLTETLTPPDVAARNCAEAAAAGPEPFGRCWIHEVSSEKQRKILECLAGSAHAFGRLVCAANPGAGEATIAAAECVAPAGGAACRETGAIAAEHARVQDCVRAQGGATWEAAVCAGQGWITPEQRRFTECAIATQRDPMPLIACYAGRALEEQVMACVTDAGGEVACFAERKAVLAAAAAWADIAPGPAIPVKGVERQNNVFGCAGWLAKRFATGC